MKTFQNSLLAFSAGLLLVACNSDKPQIKSSDVAKTPPASEAKAAIKDTIGNDAKTEATPVVVESPAAETKIDNALKDKSGNNYETLRIGDQLWAASNIREQTGVTCYANVEGDADFIKKYGCLYTWDDAQKVCPAELGWRLPTKDDYEKMVVPLGDSPRNRSKALCVSSFSGGSNASGFSALPAGLYLDGYNRFGQVAMFWTATPSAESKNDANYLLVDPSFMGAGIYDAGKEAAYSVRCVKDVK